MKTRMNIKEQKVSAVIIRKDGTREDLGVIAHFKKKTLIRRFLDWLML